MIEAEPLIGNRKPESAFSPQHCGTLLQEADGVWDVLNVMGRQNPIEAMLGSVAGSRQVSEVAGRSDEIDFFDFLASFFRDIGVDCRILPKRMSVENVQSGRPIARRPSGNGVEIRANLENRVFCGDALA
jgi:hypothetical protein